MIWLLTQCFKLISFFTYIERINYNDFVEIFPRKVEHNFKTVGTRCHTLTIGYTKIDERLSIFLTIPFDIGDN